MLPTEPNPDDIEDHAVTPYLYRGRDVEATYHYHDIPGYDGNPLIEALGPILTTEDVAASLTRLPEVRPSDRTRPIQERYHLIWNASDFYQPTTPVIHLEQKLGRLIRAGYKARNPLDPGHQRRVHARVKTLARDPDMATRPAMRRLRWAPRPQVTGLTVLGLGGVGKTTACIEILDLLYPQVIFHTLYPGIEYQGPRVGADHVFTGVQLVWLLLQCPHNRSINSLCTSFFEAVDHVMGTKYAHIYRRNRGVNRTDLLQAMARIALNHHLGVLVIDEVQVLSVVKSQGTQEMLDFFTELRNTIGVPVILIGTPRAAQVLSGELHGARRGEALGCFRWLNMQEDEEWMDFLTALWEYQYIAAPCKLDNDFAHTLYRESAGITDYAVKLFFLAQIRAIEVAATTGTPEKLTPGLIKSVARDSIPLGRAVLARLCALRPTTSFTTLASLDEIQQIAMDAAVEAAIARADGIASMRPSSAAPSSSGHGSAGPPSATPPAQASVPSADEAGTADGHSGAAGKRERRKGSTVPSPRGVEVAADSIMAITATAGERKTTPYQALVVAGLIHRVQDELAIDAALLSV